MINAEMQDKIVDASLKFLDDDFLYRQMVVNNKNGTTN